VLVLAAAAAAPASPAAPAAPAPVTPRFHGNRFYVAPHYSYFYPGYPYWSAPFPYDPYFYGPYSWPQTLPTSDMISQAIPEGVLQPNGRVDGFVYFQGISNREAAVSFDMQLVDAHANAPFARASVPMRVVLR
jgi:hypothetical protein